MWMIKSWSLLNEHIAATTVLKPPVKERLSSIDLAWHDSFAAGCLFPCVSDLYLHLPQDLTTAGFYLCAAAYAQLNIRLIKHKGYPSNLYRFGIVTLLTRPLPHKAWVDAVREILITPC